ncbi:MAG: hypothetical protein Q4D61_08075 [Cardiobacteriaceae bacterium]|nr:hypothetical protein [Cardiobacteriaceae bacterium]
MIELERDVESRLEKFAKSTGKSAAWHARAAILDYLDDMEDAATAAERLADFKAGRQDSVALDDLLTAYGLEG